jgi:hypothetical protein
MSADDKRIVEMLSGVRSRDDLISFVYSLSDHFARHPDAWENRDAGTYLAAIAHFLSDAEGS